MTKDLDNPYVRFGLDPGASLVEITERLRALAEDASDDERAALRAAWEAISRSPARRFELMLEAGPLPAPIEAPAPAGKPAARAEPTLADVLAAPALAPTLAPETERAALLATDLSFLVRADETDVTGPLGPRRSR